jgi:hypothetical protein
LALSAKRKHSLTFQSLPPKVPHQHNLKSNFKKQIHMVQSFLNFPPRNNAGANELLSDPIEDDSENEFLDPENQGQEVENEIPIVNLEQNQENEIENQEEQNENQILDPANQGEEVGNEIPIVNLEQNQENEIENQEEQNENQILDPANQGEEVGNEIQPNQIPIINSEENLNENQEGSQVAELENESEEESNENQIDSEEESEEEDENSENQIDSEEESEEEDEENENQYEENSINTRKRKFNEIHSLGIKLICFVVSHHKIIGIRTKNQNNFLKTIFCKIP